MRGLTTCLLAITLAGCANAPPDVEEPDGVPTPVRILDVGFVQFEGERIAIEFFLLEMRERVRAAAGDLQKLPRVQLSVPDGAPGVDGHWVTYLRNELHKAGVRHLAIGGAE